MSLLIVITPSLIDVSSPSLTSEILMCFLIRLLITVFSPVFSSTGTAAGAGAAGTPPANTGSSSFNPSNFSAFHISI